MCGLQVLKTCVGSRCAHNLQKFVAIQTMKQDIVKKNFLNINILQISYVSDGSRNLKTQAL